MRCTILGQGQRSRAAARSKRIGKRWTGKRYCRVVQIVTSVIDGKFNLGNAKSV